MQKLKQVFTPGSNRADTTGTDQVAYDPSFDTARGTGTDTGYGTTGGYDNTRYDTTGGSSYTTGHKGIGERIKEAIPGTAEHREKKHMQGELTGAERRAERREERDIARQSDRTDLGAGVYSPGMEGTGTGLGGTSTGLGGTSTGLSAGTGAGLAGAGMGTGLGGDRELRREEMQEGMVCMPAGGAYHEGNMEVRRQDPNVTVEKFQTAQGLEGEVITKTQQEVKIPEIPQETVEVCGTQTFTEVEDRPVVTERVIREVVHRPVEKQFEVTTRAIGERPLEKQVETLDINERVVDEVVGQKCPTSIPGYEGVQPHLETRPVVGGAGYGQRQSMTDKIESRIPGTDENEMRKGKVGPTMVDKIESRIPGTDEHAQRKHGQIPTGEKLGGMTQAPAGYEEPLSTTGRRI